MNARQSLLAGVSLMLLTVALGAFGAHVIRSHVDAQALEIWHTATRYQAWHGLGLIATGIWMERTDSASRLMHWSALALLAGVLLFSGSLYALTLTGIRQLGIITPVGGLLMLSGWLLWVLDLLRQR